MRKYAYAVIHEGIKRQLAYNKAFMAGLAAIIAMFDTVDDFSKFQSEVVTPVIEEMKAIDPDAASGLKEYIDGLYKEAEALDADFEHWLAG